MKIFHDSTLSQKHGYINTLEFNWKKNERIQEYIKREPQKKGKLRKGHPTK